MSSLDLMGLGFLFFTILLIVSMFASGRFKSKPTPEQIAREQRDAKWNVTYTEARARYDSIEDMILDAEKDKVDAMCFALLAGFYILEKVKKERGLQ